LTFDIFEPGVAADASRSDYLQSHTTDHFLLSAFYRATMHQHGADDVGNTTTNCPDNPATQCVLPSRPPRCAHGQTTLMMRSIPNDHSRDQLLQLVNCEGFERYYDFFYLPIDADSGLNLAYAFINFVDADSAKRFSKHFTGYHKWIYPSRKQCSISLSKVQGYANNVKSFKTKPLMRERQRGSKACDFSGRCPSFVA